MSQFLFTFESRGGDNKYSVRSALTNESSVQDTVYLLSDQTDLFFKNTYLFYFYLLGSGES